MYVRVLEDELQFPDDRAIDQDTKSLIRGVCSFLSVLLSYHLYISLCSFFNAFPHYGYVNLGSRSILTSP